MFCGECGHAVTSRTPVATSIPAETAVPDELVEPAAPMSTVSVPPLSEPALLEPAPTLSEPALPEEPEPDLPPEPSAPLVTAPPASEPIADPVDLAEALETCSQCGAELEASDIFCPECGFVRDRIGARNRPNDTVSFDPFPWGLPRSTEPPVAPEEAVEALPELPPMVEAVPPMPAAPPVEQPVDPPLVEELDGDVEATRIVSRTPKGERFVLQFSTGESVTVSGTGLIGRNPIAEPGEYFDALVTIVDPGKSVSKTHLEFGQDGGAFWVSDRFSGNGTVVREPDGQPKRCEPGKRYRIVRGTRVEIGEQFFIVS